jgi:uncharacterized protein (TIGR00369 family)
MSHFQVQLPSLAEVAAARGERDGLAWLRGMADGSLPTATFSTLLGVSIDEVSEGEVTVSLLLKRHLSNAFGGLHGGAIASLCDTATGFAVITTLGADETFTTMDLTTKMLRTAPLELGERLRCVGRVVMRGRRSATAQAQVYRNDGKLVATCLCTCMVMPR